MPSSHQAKGESPCLNRPERSGLRMAASASAVHDDDDDDDSDKADTQRNQADGINDDNDEECDKGGVDKGGLEEPRTTAKTILPAFSSAHVDAGAAPSSPPISSSSSPSISPSMSQYHRLSPLSSRRLALRWGQLGLGIGRWGGTGESGKVEKTHQQQQVHRSLVRKLQESTNVAVASDTGTDSQGNSPTKGKKRNKRGKGGRRNRDNENDNRRRRPDIIDQGDTFERQFPDISTIAIARRTKRRGSTEAAMAIMTTTTTKPSHFHRRHSLPGTVAATSTATTSSTSKLAEGATASNRREATAVASRRNHHRPYQQQPRQSSYTPVHRPSTMRTISGLGMEDPVAGSSASASPTRTTSANTARTKSVSKEKEHPPSSRHRAEPPPPRPPHNHSSKPKVLSDSGWYGDHPSMIFDDMSLGAVPQDMQDMVTVASDPTADTRRGIDFQKFASCLPNYDADAFSKAPPVPVFVNRRQGRSKGTATSASTGVQCPTLERQPSSDAISLSLEDLQRSRYGSEKNASGGGYGGAHASTEAMFTSASPASYPPPSTRSYIASSGSPSSPSRQRRSSLERALARQRRHSCSLSTSFETSWTGNTRASALSAVSISTMNTNQVVAEAARSLQQQQQQQQEHRDYHRYPRQHNSDSKIAAVSKELIEGALAAVSSSTFPSSAPASPSYNRPSASKPAQGRSPRLDFASPSGESPRPHWTSRRHSSDSEFLYYMAVETAEYRPSTATTTSPSSVDDDYDHPHTVEEQRRRMLSSLLRTAPLPIQEEDETTHDVDHSTSSTCDGDASHYRARDSHLSANAGMRPGGSQSTNDDATYGIGVDEDDDLTDLILLRVPSDEGDELEPRHFDRASSSRSCDDQSDEGSGETIEVVVMAVDEEDEFDDGEGRHLPAAISSVQAEQLKEHVIALFVSGHASRSIRSDTMEMLISPPSPHCHTSVVFKPRASPFSQEASSVRSLSSNVGVGSPRPPYPTFVVESPREAKDEATRKVEGLDCTAASFTKMPSFKEKRMPGSRRNSLSNFQFPEAHPLSPLPISGLPQAQSSLAALPALPVRNHSTTQRRRSATGAASERSPYTAALASTMCSVSTLRSASTSPAARSPDSIMRTRRMMPMSPASLFPEL